MASSADVPGNAAIVPFEEPGSPAKKSRTQDLLPADDLKSTISACIAEAVAANKAPMQRSLDQVLLRTTETERGLTHVQGDIKAQQQAIQELDHKWSKAIEDVRTQVVDVQKRVETSPAGSPMSSRGEGYHAVPPPRGDGPVLFDIVCGGWPEGSRKEWVEQELMQLLSSIQMSSRISKVKTYSKRPRVAKLELSFSPEAALSDKRQVQIETLRSLRSSGWSPGGSAAWFTADKTPQQRVISRGVARLSGFLSQRLLLDPKQLEVDSWPAARCYFGNSRVTGNHDGGMRSTPLGAASNVRVIEEDREQGVRMWVDLETLSREAQAPMERILREWETHFQK